MKTIFRMAAVVAIVLSSGCASIQMRTDTHRQPPAYPAVYPGARAHAFEFIPDFLKSIAVGEASEPMWALFVLPFAVTDLALCFVVDTIALPVDAVCVIKKGNQNKVIEDTGTNAPDPQH